MHLLKGYSDEIVKCPYCKEDRVYPASYGNGSAIKGIRKVNVRDVRLRIGMYKWVDARVEDYRCHTCGHEWSSEPYYSQIVK